MMQYDLNKDTGYWLCWIQDTPHAFYLSSEKKAKDFCSKINNAFESGLIRLEGNKIVRQDKPPTNDTDTST